MTMTHLSEKFWNNVKFFLLFIICFSAMYIGLTKFIFKIPVSNNQKLLGAIAEFEKVLDDQKKVSTDFKQIAEEIKQMEFKIHQVQKKDDIKREISKIRSLYINNQKNSKYKFTLNVADILLFYFHSREQYSTLLTNKQKLETNLNECQANL